MVIELVAAATKAPSMHNTQPWRFRFEADEEDDAYARPDPIFGSVIRVASGRAFIACGAALFNLRLAATVAGRHQ